VSAAMAESWPEKSRARAMQVMQMAFAFGFFVAALDNLILGPISWRWVLAAGALPAIIALCIRWFVPESERWQQARSAGKAAGTTLLQTFTTMFEPALRRRTIVGVLVSSAMMFGSWGGLTLLPSWIQQLSRAAGAPPVVAVQTISYAFMLMMIGAILGYLTLIFLTDSIGRRACYFLFCLGSLISSLFLFLTVKDLNAVMWFMPVLGYFVIGGFGTFAAYLPELFPTRVRATAQGLECGAKCDRDRAAGGRHTGRYLRIGPCSGGLDIRFFCLWPGCDLVGPRNQRRAPDRLSGNRSGRA
jgi:MFS family permease